MTDQSLRVLHFGRNTANQPKYFVNALRRLGHTAEVWEYGPDSFGYGPDRSIDISARDPRVCWDVMNEALDRFDIVHFHMRQTFFPHGWSGMPHHWDLPLLRALGKKVFFHFLGVDCIVKRIHLECNPWSYFRYSDIEANDDKTEKQLQIFRTFANKMFVLSVDYLPHVPDAVVAPRTIDLAAWPEREPAQRDVPIVLHMPSRRGKKGTDFVLAGVEKLQADGVPMDFRLLEGVSHAEARAAIADADVVIDNVITGDYELVSIETMAQSRVAVANVQEAARRFAPDAPVWSVDPDTFVDRMREVLTDRELRMSLAERGRSFVAKVHDADEVIKVFLEQYTAPDPTVPTRAFPDWARLSDSRSLEAAHERIGRLEVALARARLRAEQPPVKPAPPPARASAAPARRPILPPALRRILGRIARRAGLR